MSALEASAVGADVAAEPRGLAGEAVPIGLLTMAAEIAPGADHAPCEGVRSMLLERGTRTDLGRIEVDEKRGPVLGDAHGIVCENFCDGGLSSVFGAQNEYSGRLCVDVAIVIGRRGSVQVTECADTHLLEGEVEVCVGGHRCFVRDILCGGMAGDVQWAVSRRGYLEGGGNSSGWCSRAR